MARANRPMALGHEKLDVYRLAIGYVAWVLDRSDKLTGAHRHARDQWLRASQSIPISIAISIPMKDSPNQAVQATALRAAPDLGRWLRNGNNH